MSIFARYSDVHILNAPAARGAIVAAILVSACTGANTSSGGMMPASGPPASMGGAALSTDLMPDTSILKMLSKQVVIGSTVDPQFHQLNPYGLDVAKATAGKFTKGDLAVCNFNAKSNVQGTGFTIVALHPVPGSKPRLVAADKATLLGCDAMALGPDDSIWAAAFVANDNPVFSPSGALVTNLSGRPFDHPFGQTYAMPAAGKPAYYESNAGDGTIVRISLNAMLSREVIATGFAVNHGKPGSILGPSGLQYDASNDTLYVVDGTNNTVVALERVTTMHNRCLTVDPGGKTFSGNCASQGRLVYAGAPLNGPISSALLFNGNLVIGNTGNPDGKNLMIELTRGGKLLAVRNVDNGPAGALFGIVAIGTTAADTKIYFNDDNDNNLQVLEQ